MTDIRRGITAALALMELFSVAAAHAGDPDRRGVDFFENKVRPVLVEHCYRCHSDEAKKVRGGLRLDSAAGLLKGGDSGPAIVPGEPARSLLLKALRHEGELKMPSETKKLPAAVLADFETWIKMGAPDPRQGKPTAKSAINLEESRKFWAFQHPVARPTPTVKDLRWVANEIDAFVLAEQERRGLRRVRPAGKRELIRRATFDLIGLPPTPEEIEAFEKDPSPDAFARVVDRLLASPHYGERWGRYWLDLARYADDKALAFPTPWPHAYRYRDWVVRAFNEDMPYDRFLRLQLAGDLIPENEDGDRERKLVALGFQGLGAEYHKGSVPEQVKADELDDRIDTLTRGLLGLTVACARCHDHKYDPIPTRDYYSLAAAYNGAAWNVLTLSPPAEVARYKAWEKTGKEIEARIRKWRKQHPGSLSPEARKPLDAMQAELQRHRQSTPPALVQTHGVSGGGGAMRVALRGNVKRLGEPAPPGFLRILESKPAPSRTRFTRLDLAEAICSPDNPLTARVIVNRVWQHHFGRGIVSTASNFGKLGDRPTHPRLLDNLAVHFVQSGWSIKWLHRRMMLSSAYRLSAEHDAGNAAIDPDNAYLWRHTPQRLDIEAWRDAILAVSGQLDRTFGGPPVSLAEPGHVRRTLYGKVSRLEPDKMLVAFDFPDANVSSARRSVTVVPQQQLFVLNSEFMIASAKALAQRLEKAADKDEERIALAHRWAFGRTATESEIKLALEFLRSAAAGPDDKLTAWQQLAQAILASNELVWID
ncbi:MAG TPA: PSD1 and planctomycete cytochrome C domain-containing protein [Gemmataceae bacterium]|nr:PSD1 and planctomycete cytochrome C domain-containing protein [Gemmataceae bacterium]